MDMRGFRLSVRISPFSERHSKRLAAQLLEKKRLVETPGGGGELATLLEFLRDGDTLVVTRVNRLGRSIRDLQDIVHFLKGRNVALKATEQPIDTSTAAGKAFLDMLGVFAEFETNLRRERQMEGIAEAKAGGVYAGKGRKQTVDTLEVRRLQKAGRRPSDIARDLKISRASVYRHLETGVIN